MVDLLLLLSFYLYGNGWKLQTRFYFLITMQFRADHACLFPRTGRSPHEYSQRSAANCARENLYPPRITRWRLWQPLRRGGHKIFSPDMETPTVIIIAPMIARFPL